MSQVQSNWMAAKILIKLNSEWVNEDSLDNVRIDASAWAAYTSQSSPLKVSLNRPACFGRRFIWNMDADTVRLRFAFCVSDSFVQATPYCLEIIIALLFRRSMV